MTQKQKIISMLRVRGQQGICNYEFPQNFILNYKARLDELREAGHKIKTIRVKDNVWKYVLDYKEFGKQTKDWRAEKRLEKIKEMESRGQGRLV